MKHFVGIDVSKSTLDFSFVTDGEVNSHVQIRNTVIEIRQFISKLLNQHRATMEDTLFCMEYTGIYNLPLVNWLQTQKAKVWMESAVQISKRSGIARGKNDKLDGSRIAMYAFTNRHQVRLGKRLETLSEISPLYSPKEPG